MAILQMMLGAVVDVSRDVAPELWKRFLTLVLDGMRTGGTRASELGAPPVPVERIP